MNLESGDEGAIVMREINPIVHMLLKGSKIRVCFLRKSVGTCTRFVQLGARSGNFAILTA
jgi:hypothetical protein